MNSAAFLTSETEVFLGDEPFLDDGCINSSYEGEKRYLQTISALTPLTEDETIKILTELRKNPEDEDLRNKIIEGNLQIVAEIVSEFVKNHDDDDFEDLLSEGYLGLQHAVIRFDGPITPFYFYKYIRFGILNSIMRYRANHQSTVRISINAQKELLKKANSEAEIHSDIFRQTDEALLSDHKFDYFLKEKLDPFQTWVVSQNECQPLDQVITDYYGIEDTKFQEPFIQSFDVKSFWDNLDEREKFIVCARNAVGFNHLWTLEELSEHLNRTRERIRQLEKSGYDKLRANLLKKGYHSAEDFEGIYLIPASFPIIFYIPYPHFLIVDNNLFDYDNSIDSNLDDFIEHEPAEFQDHIPCGALSKPIESRRADMPLTKDLIENKSKSMQQNQTCSSFAPEINSRDKIPVSTVDDIFTFAFDQPSGQLEYSKPVSLTLPSGTFHVESWKDILSLCCSFAFLNNPDAVNSLRDAETPFRKSVLFSSTPGNMRKPEKLASDLYMETHFSAFDIVKNVGGLMAYCGFPVKEFSVTYRVKSSAPPVPESKADAPVSSSEFSKTLDFSTFTTSITIPVKCHETFLANLSVNLERGQSHPVTLVIGEHRFLVSINNVGFSDSNRKQVLMFLWRRKSPIAKSLQATFPEIFRQLEEDHANRTDIDAALTVSCGEQPDVFKITMDSPLIESKESDVPAQGETAAPIFPEASAQNDIHGVCIQENWIRFDFTNAPSFEGTVPAYCCIDGNVFEGRNWVRILVALVEFELAKGNPALEDLYEKPLYCKKAVRPFFMKSRIEGSRNCSELSNGYWINVGWPILFLMRFIQAFLLHCGYDKRQIEIYGKPRANKENGSAGQGNLSAASEQSDVFQIDLGIPLVKNKEPVALAQAEITVPRQPSHPQYGVPKKNNSSTHESSPTKKTEAHGVDTERAATFLKTAGLQGATVQELIDAIQPNAAFWPTKNMLEENLNVIAMPDNRYVHADCFVDLDEAEDALGKILSSHFARFDGYSNNQLLFGAALQELSMFLNDNDCENINAVYAIARYLFEKKAASGEKYKFAPPHIFETEPDHPLNLRGLMIRLARSNGGILQEVDAKNYLQKTMLTYGSMGQLLQVGNDKTFLMYDRDRYLLSEVIGIDDAWCRQMHDRMDDLFRKANVAYVIPRDISEAWLSTLPVLPLGLAWTPLLLQEILDKYPAIGFKSISAGLNQAYHTLAAAFVPIDSPLQTFPDVVTLFMEEHHKLPARMSGEELRSELRDKGMLEAGEMIYSIHKALNDYRFAWTDENKTVLIRGNK